jgi:hypothetical protein
MLKKIRKLPDGVIGVEASGVISSEDYSKVLVPMLDKVRKEGKKARFLYHYTPKVEGFTLGAAWQDFRVGLRHMRFIASAAVVTDSPWLRRVCRVCARFMPMNLRVFPERSYDDAVEWLACPAASGLKHTLLAEKGVLIIEPEGALKKSDFDSLAATIDPWVENHEELKGLVIHVKKFPGWQDLGSMLSHIVFVKEHHRMIKKVAIVADGVLPELAPIIAGHFVSAEIKNFDYLDLAKAVSWIES